MTDPTPTPAELEIRKFLRAEREGHVTELMKGLIATNSGGAIAVLGFMQALAKDHALGNFKLPGLVAFATFILGVVLALILPTARVDQVDALRRKTGSTEQWRKKSYWIAGFSIACFTVGALAIGLGIYVSF